MPLLVMKSIEEGILIIMLLNHPCLMSLFYVIIWFIWVLKALSLLDAIPK